MSVQRPISLVGSTTGVTVDWSVKAWDNSGDAPETYCTPSQDWEFQFGTTTVVCNARDGSHNRGSCQFDVEVTGKRLLFFGVIDIERRLWSPAILFFHHGEHFWDKSFGMFGIVTMLFCLYISMVYKLINCTLSPETIIPKYLGIIVSAITRHRSNFISDSDSTFSHLLHRPRRAASNLSTRYHIERRPGPGRCGCGVGYSDYSKDNRNGNRRYNNIMQP